MVFLKSLLLVSALTLSACSTDAGDSDASPGGGPSASGGTGGTGGASQCTSATDYSDACRTERDQACAGVPQAQCDSAEFCGAISGQKIDDDGACVGSSEIIGCAATDLGCTGAYTRVKDLEGDEWILPSGCKPYGWTEASLSGTNLPPCGMDGRGGAGGSTP